MKKLIVFNLSLILLLSLVLIGCQPKQDAAQPSVQPKATATPKKERVATREKQLPEWMKNAVMYEVNIRQYTHEGTFAAFEPHLQRLKDLGVDVIWFMPIHPISKENRKGVLGSYYSVADYKGVNPEFGTMDEFKALVKKCHDMGFHVIMDWVANHTGWDNPWIKEHPEWYTRTAAGKIIHPPGTDWTDVADLNFKNEDMSEAMIEAMAFWVKEADVDGFREDHASGVPVKFWKDVRIELDNIKPVFMLAEDNSDMEMLRKAFDANYSWEFYHMMDDVAQEKRTLGMAFSSFFSKMSRNYPDGTIPLQFITNHDENSWNGSEFERFKEGAVPAMAALYFTVPGIPLVYSGQEAALTKRLKFFEKDEIDWTDMSLTNVYQDLIRFKHENAALWNGKNGGDIDTIDTSDEKVLAYTRKKDGNQVIILLNLSSAPSKVTVKYHSQQGKYHTFPEPQEVTLKDEQNYELKPWEYRLFYRNQ